MPLSFKSLAAVALGFCGPLLLIALLLFGDVALSKGSGRAYRGFSLWPGIGGSQAQASGPAKEARQPEPTQSSAAANPTPAADGTHANLLPWPFHITSEFGHYPNGQPHYGLDLDATYGVIQTAPVGGTVEDVLRGCVEGNQSCGGGWGNHVWWKSAETGHHILLAHFSKLEDWVQVGATVTVGQAVGVTGATGYASGPHVHIQVNTERCCENPGSINPAWEFPWLRCGEPVLGGRFGAECSTP
jgi:murein DD-endopeptidase MepM/ murein hydrolase activator NlpD